MPMLPSVCRPAPLENREQSIRELPAGRAGWHGGFQEVLCCPSGGSQRNRCFHPGSGIPGLVKPRDHFQHGRYLQSV